MLMKVLGILGIIVGIVILVATATGNHSSSGYFSGAIFIVFGVMRFLRGMSR